MATIDELKKNDGTAVQMGAVRPNPAARGFAPSSFGDASAASSNPEVQGAQSAALNQPAARGFGATPEPTARGFASAPLDQPKLGAVRANNFGDGAASSLDARVSQIPTVRGAFPPPAPDGQSNIAAKPLDSVAGGAANTPAPTSRGFAMPAGALPFKSDAAAMMRDTRAADQSIKGVTGFTPAPATPAPVQSGGATGSWTPTPAASGSSTAPAAPQPTGFTPPGADEGVIPGTRAVMNGFSDDANRNIKDGNYGALAGNTIKATATMPFALAADAVRPVTSRLEGVGRGMYDAASTLFGGNESAGSAPSPAGAVPRPATPATPGTPAALAQSAASPAPAGTQPQANPALDGATPSPNLVTRTGNSYSGGPNIRGDIELAGTRGGMISAQNNQAAENLARAGGQTRGFGPAGAVRGGGQVSAMDTSAGFSADLKQLAGIDANKAATEANMKAQEAYAQNKVLEGRALAGNRGALRLLTQNKDADVAKRSQDIQAGATRDNYKLAQAKLGLETSKDGRDATAAGFQSRSAGRIEALQAAYESAKPEDRSAIAEQLRVLTGKDKPAQWKALALQGATDATGNKTEGVLAAINEQTGEVKRVEQGGGQVKPAAGAVSAPTSQAQYDALPKGAKYTHPDGTTRTKG